MKRSVLWMIMLAVAMLPLVAQDPDTCTVKEQEYGTSGNFDPLDFLADDQGIVTGSTLGLDTQDLDLDNLVLGLDQPFYVDYLSEGAGASHLFGFFFFDIDTDKDGLPDFLETAGTDDLDGDGLINADDDDDDNDGIPDVSDTRPAGITQMPAAYFRNGTVAAANSISGIAGAPDYWQFLPNSVINDPGGKYDGYFEHPGVYLYVDGNSNEIPDILEFSTGANKIPPYLVDKGYKTKLYTGTNFEGLLGTWSYEGTPGNTVDDKYHWLGSTIFYIADDDGGTGQTGHYLNYTPYGNKYKDVFGSANAHPDYLIYGTSDITNSAIPDELKVYDENDVPSAKLDPRGEEMWRYRWYESNISGAREMVFFLVVFWGSGSSNVNSYYSKSAFNKDSAPGSPTRNGATNGDAFGGWAGRNNWFPHRQNNSNHNDLSQGVWGKNWSAIATRPTDGTSPQLLSPPANPLATQAWVDEFENYRYDRRIIQYRALADWFSETAVDANTIINGRYGINMAAENDSSIIRASNGNMVHLMVGAPKDTKNAWLLGWEDLFRGGDRDFEDVVFYVKREAGGQIQSLNVAKDLAEGLAADADYSLSQVNFKYEDNFTDNNWGTERRYINYFYRFGNAEEWIPLLGGQHLRDPDVFQPAQGGSTTVASGVVTRSITLQVADKATELYWKVEMSTDSVDTFKPEVYAAIVGYQSLVHDFYYNSAVLPNSNINYFASFESPAHSWTESKNRGHLYALQTFVHGTAATFEATIVNDADSPELNPEVQPSSIYTYKKSAGSTDLFKWDAAVSLKDQVENVSKTRKIYTYLSSLSLDGALRNDLRREDLDFNTPDADIVSAMELNGTKSNGIWLHNFHDPGATVQDTASASLWLINWIHGYYNPIVADQAVVSRDQVREWVMGGVNRASPMIVRAPGLPYWVENSPGSDIKIADRTSYINFAKSQNSLETRIIIGSDNGLIHCINAGKWVGEVETSADGLTEYQWADGHYKDEDFGTGEEVWAFLPGHLLEDVKYNYTNSNPDAAGVVASSDGTGTHTIVKDDNGDWRRIAVFSQGYQGGTLTAGSTVRTGNAIWAMDITDPDDPIPLWHRQDRRVQNIINPPAMAWMEFASGDPKWVVAYSSGGTPVIDKKPAFYLVEAMTGIKVALKGVGSTASKGVNVMLGTPALVDSDQNGYADMVVGATSEGRVYVYDTRTSVLKQKTYAGASFYLAPNIRINSDNSIDLVAASGDNPLIYDEPSGNFTNTVYLIRFDAGTWTNLGDFDLPANHKLFSRPKVVNDQLVVGTTTGDTFNFCDFDPDEPGDLLLYDLNAIGTDPLQERVRDFGSVLAPIVVADKILVHTSTSDSEEPNNAGSALRVIQSPNNAVAPTMVSVGETFGVLAWQDEILKKLRSYKEN